MLMELEEWELLLGKAGLLDGDDFTKRHATLVFVWAQSFCTDDLKRRVGCVHLTYVDFLEAIARVCTIKPLPTAAILAETSCRSVAHFFSQPLLLAKLRRPIRWQEEEVSQNALAEPLRMVISLMIERLDTSGTGVLRATELRKLL